MGSETHGDKNEELVPRVDCQGLIVKTKISNGGWQLFALFQLRIQFLLFSLRTNAHWLTCLLCTKTSHPHALEKCEWAYQHHPILSNTLWYPFTSHSQEALCPRIKQHYCYSSAQFSLWSALYRNDIGMVISHCCWPMNELNSQSKFNY